jgi:hypothetical protein
MNYIKLLESLLFKPSYNGKLIVISGLGKDLASCWERRKPLEQLRDSPTRFQVTRVFVLWRIVFILHLFTDPLNRLRFIRGWTRIMI